MPIEEAVRIVLTEKINRGTHFHLSNAYCVALAERDKAYRDVLNDGVVFADGKPIEWVSRLRRDFPRVQQVRGPSLFELALAAPAISEQRVRHFLLGGSESSLGQLQAEIARRFPQAVICGSSSPPFRALTPQELLDQDRLIIAANPTVIWVGLGTPKQDFECQRLTASTGITTVAIGAAFDFTAGTAKVAPRWMRTVGLEWFFRLCTEPRRLWRRYLIGNLVFIKAVARGWRAS